MTTTIEAPYAERVVSALLQPLHEEQARRAGKKHSVRSGVPGVYAIGEVDPISAFASLANMPEAFEIVDANCTQCREPLQCMRIQQNSTACDPCREKHLRAQQEEKHEKYWSQDHLCPSDSHFRDTSKDHAGFPKNQYEQTKAYAGTESLFFYGPTGSGKSRLAMHLLKRCLFKYNLFVGILWPEDLKQARNQYDRKDVIARFGKFEVLLMDDTLLTGAQDEKMTDFLRDLLDYRMRHKRHQIITSQVGGADYKEQLGKWTKNSGVTSVDDKRVDALLRRINDMCRVVPFIRAIPKEDEAAF